MVQSQEDTLRQDNERRRQAREEAQKREREAIAKSREQQARVNNEKMERDAKLRPTPTVEEVQIALSGQRVDEKEPDGSPEQNPHHPVASASAQIEVSRKLSEAKPVSETGSYSTRASTARETPVPTPPASKKE